MSLSFFHSSIESLLIHVQDLSPAVTDAAQQSGVKVVVIVAVALDYQVTKCIRGVVTSE